MGEYADMMINGLCCQSCGELMDDHDEPGYARWCDNCRPNDLTLTRKERHAARVSAPKQIKCPECSKKFSGEYGLSMHVAAKHGVAS